MKALRFFNRLVSLMIIVVLALPLPGLAQDAGNAAPSPSFSKEQLAQMLAPIALYPDSLLSQILMASTYPLEVVEADRWMKVNKGLKGDALDEALKTREWDPSVESLCHFPEILGAMSEKIGQTTRLGDAFLAQQDDVMAMVQELRAKARQEGNLRSTGEQNVVVEKETIIIEPANPEVIYVPSYDPAYVYGNWWYPAYPPYYWWPGAVGIGLGISFWPGIYVGAFIGAWSYFDWYNHTIYIDWHHAHHFHGGHHDRDGKERWHHDTEHRRGVAYRERSTAVRFGQAPERSREYRREQRGFSDRGAMDRQTRNAIRKDMDTSQPRRIEGSRQAGERVRERPAMPQRENVFNGRGDVRRERMESERGRSSRENSSRSSRSISRGNDVGRSQGSRIQGNSGQGNSGQGNRSQGGSRSQGSGRSSGGNSGRTGR